MVFPRQILGHIPILSDYARSPVCHISKPTASGMSAWRLHPSHSHVLRPDLRREHRIDNFGRKGYLSMIGPFFVKHFNPQ